jgi:hypothetical protein
VPRCHRDEATRLARQKGFAKSTDTSVGEWWRNPKTGDRVLIPNDKTISEKNFRQILNDVGYKSSEIEIAVQKIKSSPVVLGTTLVSGIKSKK